MPVSQMHAGEEILWVVIPAFVVLMLVDMVKRRKMRRDAAGSGEEFAGEEGRGESAEDEGESPPDSTRQS